MKRLVALAVLGAGLARPLPQAVLPGSRQAAPAQDVARAIDAIAQDALRRPVAGLSIAVARRGQIVFARGYGLANIERAVPVTPGTIFHIASVSKNVEAAVVMKLVEEGKLSLDEDVTRYVPDAPTHGRRVTLRQLLTHTSGLYSFTSLPDAEANERLDLSHAQVLALVKDRPFDFVPGSSWRYSNSGFYLAGMAIERVTGQPYATYVRDRVFRPLRMTSSSLCTSHDDVRGLAAGYEVSAGALGRAPFMTWSLPFAAGGICATAGDLLKWATALDEGTFISRAHVAEMRTQTALSDGTRIDYGLGTRLGSLHGHLVTGHTGSGGGYHAVLEAFPDDGLTVVVLTNTGDAPVTSIAAYIARAVLAIAPPPLRDLPVPADEAASLAGLFDSDEGSIENFACGDKLCFRPPGAKEGFPARRQAPFAYAIDADLEIRFQQTSVPAEWGVLYSGGLMADAKRRIHR